MLRILGDTKDTLVWNKMTLHILLPDNDVIIESGFYFGNSWPTSAVSSLTSDVIIIHQ